MYNVITMMGIGINIYLHINGNYYEGLLLWGCKNKSLTLGVYFIKAFLGRFTRANV
jgi:hypothetical protein